MEAGGGGNGGPAPFLLKTYDMVDDSATDDIVSWSAGKNSFVVWNPPEFSRLLLPTYFKHNNFSSFIRQLNTYGFRKSDPERWEFANEDFMKDQKHLLKNIHRRKPIHSHSNPPGSSVDPERAAFDEEIEKLTREKETLQANISHIKHQLSEKHQYENAMQRMNGIEKRQENLQNVLEKAVQDPAFIDYLVQKIESLEFSAYNKKRRLPDSDQPQPDPETSFVENNIITRTDIGNPIHQDFSNKLRLELSPVVSDINLVSNSTQSSNEDEISHMKTPEIRTEDLFLAPEAIELTDTGTSFGFKMGSSFPRKINRSLTEDDDTQISCQLNLTLASLPLQELGKSPESRTDKESGIGVSLVMGNSGSGEKTLQSSGETSKDRETPAKVNDVFWEQFLTERPGCAENEETSSNFWGSTYDEQNNGRYQGISRNARLAL